jgi:hypothetical protein
MRAHRILFAALSLLALQVSPAFAQKAKRGPKGTLRARATRGRVISVSENGFDVQTGGKKAPSPTTTHVNVSGGTKFMAVNRGALGDLKANDLVAVVGEAQPDGKIAASGVLRLWEVSGEPTTQDERLAAAVVGSARTLFRPGGKKAAAGAASTPGQPAGAKPKQTRPTLGKVLSVSPLKVSRAGQTIEITTGPQTAIGAVTTISLKDLRAGDTVSFVGPAAPASAAGQPSTASAEVVVRAAGKVKKKAKAGS